ncbi:putative integral membrane protein (TIGR00698 family) [Scopulibacillus daqui]|uniref:Integral membrane protein (TIGR00698 family) n=1 Tax=Scopulibacillus daqui TaxID=1469162 RepID=A0ABS2Q006_9BACL|nr:putative sulfate exporter family transporter [Scopulibacillus daqui]MBM7645627.1 putative integral membrane protein (TIGR00698 family) [Scopulibacillus daqui]
MSEQQALREDFQNKPLNQAKRRGSQEPGGGGNQALLWMAGVGFTFVIALIGFFLAKIPGFSMVGPMACSIVIAVIYRQIFGYPESLRNGITFSSKKLLRYAIVLFGLKLNVDTILHHGLGLLQRDVFAVVFAIVATVLLAKLFKADMSLSFLLGVGTGVCGASAIAAVSPIVKAKEEDTAIGAGIIALMGTIFAIAYTILRPYLPLSAIEYGIWSGSSLHEIAHVALAGAPAGQNALAIALLAKLGRVFLLVPLCLVLVWWMNRKGKEKGGEKIEFPYFLIGFVAMSLFGSYVLGQYIPVTKGFMDGVSSLTSFILTMAMVGLGLNVSFKALKSKAFRPLLAMTITSVLLSFAIFMLV